MFPRKDDYGPAALARVPTQFRGKPRFEALLLGLADGCQDAEVGLYTLWTGRRLDSAVGAALDVLGRIVDEERRGQADEPYRLRIRARLAVNRSSGSGPELLRIFGLLTDLPLLLREEFPAAFTLTVGGDVLLYPEVYADVLQEAKAGGVRGLLCFLVAPAANILTLADSDGSGVTPGQYLGDAEPTVGAREALFDPIGTTAPSPTLAVEDASQVPTGLAAVRVRIPSPGPGDGTTYEYSLDDGATWIIGIDSTDTTPHHLTTSGDVDGPRVGLQLDFPYAPGTTYAGGEVWRWTLTNPGGVLASCWERWH